MPTSPSTISWNGPYRSQVGGLHFSVLWIIPCKFGHINIFCPPSTQLSKIWSGHCIWCHLDRITVLAYFLSSPGPIHLILCALCRHILTVQQGGTAILYLKRWHAPWVGTVGFWSSHNSLIKYIVYAPSLPSLPTTRVKKKTKKTNKISVSHSAAKLISYYCSTSSRASLKLHSWGLWDAWPCPDKIGTHSHKISISKTANLPFTEQDKVCKD